VLWLRVLFIPHRIFLFDELQIAPTIYGGKSCTLMQELIRKIDVDEHANKEDMIANRNYRCCFDVEVFKVIVRDILSFSMIYVYELTFDSLFLYSDLIDLLWSRHIAIWYVESIIIFEKKKERNISVWYDK